MAWYRVGTVSVTSGSPAVVGAGTSWLDNAQAGDGFRGPDGRVYEILSVDSDTAITLAENYLGSNAAGAAYGIFATQARIVALAQQVAQLLADYSGVLTGAGAGKFGNGTEAAPGISFAADLDTGFYRVASNTIGTVTAGVLRTAVTAAGDYGVGTLTPNKLTVSRAITVNGSLNSAFEVAAGDVSCGWLFGSPSRVTLETNGAIPLTVNVNGAEAYRVDTSRNLLIGTTTAAQRLTVGGSARVLGGNFELDTGMVTSNSGANPLRFGVNNVPLMSLDAAGNFGVGTTAPVGRLNVVGGDLSGAATGLIVSTDLAAGRLVSDASYSRINALSGYYDTMTLEMSAGSSGGYVSGVVVAARSAASARPDSVGLWTRSIERAYVDASGNLVMSAPAAPPALGTNGTVVMNLTANGNLRISARGSDGVTRVANIALA